jgi:LacI family transcriptional regulator
MPAPRNVIGIAAPEPGRGRFGFTFARQVWNGLTDAAEEFEQDLLYIGRNSSDRMLKNGSGYLQIPVDGFVFIAPQMDAPALRLLYEEGIPFATIAGQLDLPYPSFGSDNVGGVRQALSFLRQLGHTRIAHIAGPSNYADGALRERAYREFMAEKKMEVPAEYVQRGAFTFDSGASAARSLLRLAKPPTAIFAANDMIAFGAMSVAAEMGVPVPTALSVVGFDDEDHAHLFKPALTTVRQPAIEAARQALKAVVDMVGGVKNPQGRKLPTELIVRESTAPII